MSSLVVAVVYVGGCLLVMSTFSYFWRRRKAATVQLEPWFPEHKTRDIYYALVNADPPANEIQRKSALLRRAMTDIMRLGEIHHNKQALATLLQQGAVGDDLWNSLLAAEAELYNEELNDVVQEANKYKADWGQTIFQTAQEMVMHERQKEVEQQMREMKEKEEKAAKVREAREKAEEAEIERQEREKSEKERKQAEKDLLKMLEEEEEAKKNGEAKKNEEAKKNKKAKGKKKVIQ